MDLALTGNHGECMASRKRVTLQRRNFGSTLWRNYVKGRQVGSRFHRGLASIFNLMSELATQKAPDMNAFCGAEGRGRGTSASFRT